MFKTYTFDYANYNFVFRDYAHFRLSWVSTITHAKMNFLQDHFSFMLMYFVPFYWLLNWLTGSYTLLIIQTAIILLSGWFLYKLIELKTQDKWLGLAALLHYFIIQNRHSAFTSDCNIGIMATCLIPIFLYFFESKRFWAATVIFILALLSRENMSLWFIFIALILILWHRKEKKEVIISLAYIGCSILYFFILFKFLIPSFESPEKHYTLFNFKVLGSGPAEAIGFLIRHPRWSFKLLFVNHIGDVSFDGIKLEFYIVYLISGGFLLALRPQYLIWFIPIVAQKMFNDDPVRWGIELYYSIEVATILSITAFIIISEFKRLRYLMAVAVCAMTLVITIIKLDYKNRVIGHWWQSKKEVVFAKGFFNAGLNVKEAHRLIKLIPDNAKVCASDRFLPHLAQRDFAYFFPYVMNAEYIMALKSHDCYLITPEKYDKELNKYLSDSHWTCIAEDNDMVLLKRTKE